MVIFSHKFIIPFIKYLIFNISKVENIEIREGSRLPVHMLKTNEWRMFYRFIFLQNILYFYLKKIYFIYFSIKR